jgi:hypothetical protein
MATTFTQTFVDLTTVVRTTWFNGVDAVLNKIAVMETSVGSSENAVLQIDNAGGAKIGMKLLTGEETYDPASLAQDTGVTEDVTVTGAVVGDVAFAHHTENTGGVNITAVVSAPDTVTCRLHNSTTGALDIASGTLTAIVIRPV